MAALDNRPTNLNYLTPLNFKFVLKRAPHVNFFIQKVSIPSISLFNVSVPNPYVNIPYPGEHISYGNLEVEFKVDEDLKNYLEIHNWMRALGKPFSYEEYKPLQNASITSGEGIKSDISLQILTNIKTSNYELVFIDAFPVDLSGISFNTTDTDINYLEATATFKYTYYNINQVV